MKHLNLINTEVISLHFGVFFGTVIIVISMHQVGLFQSSNY